MCPGEVPWSLMLPAPLTGTILFCEDDDAVRCVTRRILERAGYLVLPATSGDEALHLMESHDGKVDLLITDVVMPGMSGPELASRLRKVAPDLRILFVSGFAAEHLEVVENFGSGAAFLPKPYTSASLSEMAAYLIDD